MIPHMSEARIVPRIRIVLSFVFLASELENLAENVITQNAIFLANCCGKILPQMEPCAYTTTRSKEFLKISIESLAIPHPGLNGANLEKQIYSRLCMIATQSPLKHWPELQQFPLLHMFTVETAPVSGVNLLQPLLHIRRLLIMNRNDVRLTEQAVQEYLNESKV